MHVQHTCTCTIHMYRYMYSVNIAKQHGNARDLKCNMKTDACRFVKQCIMNAVILWDIWVSGTAGVGGWSDGVVTWRRTFRWRWRLHGNVAFARLDRRTRVYTRRCTAESVTSHKHNSRIETTHTNKRKTQTAVHVFSLLLLLLFADTSTHTDRTARTLWAHAAFRIVIPPSRVS